MDFIYFHQKSSNFLVVEIWYLRYENYDMKKAQMIGQKIEIKTLQGMFQFSMGVTVETPKSIDLYVDSH